MGLLKFISPLVHPLGVAWLILWMGAAICLKRRRYPGALACTLGATLLWFVSQPPLAAMLVGALERPWLNRTVRDAPAADAIIVLGGGWRPSRADVFGLDFTPSCDRWIAGLELCRLGKSQVLVVGGDSTDTTPEEAPASEDLRQWLRQWGLSQIELESLGPVDSTRDEAERASELVRRKGWKKVLLVTSAFHLRRSIATFEKAGIPIEPVACDFQVERGIRRPPRWRLFPDEESLAMFGLWWHEELGWLGYRCLGSL